jgi:hypothetical protein
MSVWLSLRNLASKVSADITALANRIVYLEHNVAHSAMDVSKELVDKDPNTGLYRSVIFKRPDETLLRKDEYSSDPELPIDDPPVMNLRTSTIYGKDGVNVLAQHKYRVTYDENDQIISEVLLDD